MAYQDSHGKALSDYPQPSVAVDVALLTLVPDEPGWRLAVVITQDPVVGLALPGVFLRVDLHETLQQAALRALETKAGVSGVDPQQLGVFDAVDRDPRGRVLSVAHVDLVRYDALEPTTRLLQVAGETSRVVLPKGQAGLAYDHAEIVTRAVAWARDEYEARPDPRHLLPRMFTMYQLRRVHEAIAGKTLDKDTFRRTLERNKLVERLPERAMSSTVGRTAHLYRRTNARKAPPAG